MCQNAHPFFMYDAHVLHLKWAGKLILFPYLLDCILVAKNGAKQLFATDYLALSREMRNFAR